MPREIIGYISKYPGESFPVEIDLASMIPAGEMLHFANVFAHKKYSDPPEETTSEIVDSSSADSSTGVVTIQLKAGGADKRHVIEIEAFTDTGEPKEAEIECEVGSARKPIGYVTKQPAEVFFIGVDFDSDLRGAEAISGGSQSSTDKETGTDTTGDVLQGVAQPSGSTVLAHLKAGLEALGRHRVLIGATTDAGNVYQAVIELEVAETR